MIIRKGGEYIILKQNILVNTLTNTNFALVFTIYDQLIGRFLPIGTKNLEMNLTI
jgi:hypothetical protein